MRIVLSCVVRRDNLGVATEGYDDEIESAGEQHHDQDTHVSQLSVRKRHVRYTPKMLCAQVR